MQIAHEINAVAIARHLNTYGYGLETNLVFVADDVEKGLEYLKENEYVSCERGYIYLTISGREWLYSISPNSSVTRAKDVLEFRDEVQTGLRIEKPRGKPFIVSERTKIENPALPKLSQRKDSGQGDLLAKMMTHAANSAKMLLEIIRKETGASDDQIFRWADEGRIRPCKGFQRDSHLGVFHKSVKGFRYLCRACEKVKKCKHQ